MSKPVFYAYASRRGPEGNTKAFLTLPAMPYEMLDMLDELRLGTNDAVKVRIDEYYSFLSVAPLLADQNDLLELNALAQRLSKLDHEQATAFEGLLEINIRAKEGPIGLPDIINMAYSTQSCQVIGKALNDSQLGRYCAENGLIPEVDDLPEQVFDLLDFERLGREYRQKKHGVFIERTSEHSGGYVERQGDLIEAYKSLDLTLKTPDYAILLEVAKHSVICPECGTGKTVLVKLPAALDTLRAVPDTLGAEGWQEIGWHCLDCKVPMLAETISGSVFGIDFLNNFAKMLAEIETDALPAYKALLETEKHQDLLRTMSLAERLEDYTFSPNICSPTEMATGELSTLLNSQDLEMLIPCVDIQKYGRVLLQSRGATLTPYGLLERKDGQPVQTLWQEPTEGGITLA